MSVRSIRSFRRYAMRLPVRLQRSGAKSAKGLLIELSQHGARISNLGQNEFEPDQEVTLAMPCGLKLGGTVRWAHDGIAGIKLSNALHVPEMSALLDSNNDHAEQSQALYGT